MRQYLLHHNRPTTMVGPVKKRTPHVKARLYGVPLNSSGKSPGMSHAKTELDPAIESGVVLVAGRMTTVMRTSPQTKISDTVFEKTASSINKHGHSEATTHTTVSSVERQIHTPMPSRDHNPSSTESPNPVRTEPNGVLWLIKNIGAFKMRAFIWQPSPSH